MISINYSDKLEIDPFSRYMRHKIQTKIQGSGNGKKTILLNLIQLAKELVRDEKTIGSYIAKSLGTRYTISKNNQSCICGHFSSRDIDIVIQKFIESQVLCVICGNPETKLNKDNIVCLACGSTSIYDNK